MRFPRPARRRDRENVVPLINVVFLLLVFFLLTGTLRGPESAALDLPRAALGSPARGQPPVLAIQRSGHLLWSGEPIEPDALAARAAGLSLVRVRADARTRADALLPTLAALRAAGVDEIELVVRPPAAPR